MKKTLSPKLVFISGSILYALVVLVSIKLVTLAPWLGVGFSVDSLTGNVSVESIDSKSATFNILSPGETVVAIHGNGNSVALSKELLNGMPFDFKTYLDFNHFFRVQTQAFSILSEGKVVLELNEHTFIEITPKTSRPIKSLPVMFWLQLFLGGAFFFIGMSVLAYGSKEVPAVNVCFALAGLSFLIITSVSAIYVSREIAVDGSIFSMLAMIKYYASLSFAAFFVLIFCFYPIRIKELKIFMMLLLGLCGFSLLHIFQVFESIALSVYALFYVIGALGLLFIILQYKYTRGLIVERASLRWLVYALISGDVLFFIISIIPLVTNTELIHKQFFYWIVLLCAYIGVALGIRKYKLFKLELWALYSWVWMFGGLVVLGVAVLLILVLKISSVVALLFSALVVGWLYFPLRQWLWANYAFGFNRTHYQERLPELLETILSPKAVRSNKEQWEFLLRQVFEPVLVMHETDDDGDEAIIKESGAVLHVPEFDDIPALALAGVERGSRLFNANDVSFLTSIMTLFRNAQQFKGAYEQGVHEERTRIARDLHDDVAARLLTLIHKSEGTPQEPLAREALITLRESINSLGGQQEQSLDDVLRELQVDIKFRLGATNIELYWEQDRQVYKKTFTSRQATNFKRVSQEIITNILKHANANIVNIETNLIEGIFILSVCDDGATKLMNDWVNGRGVNNIRTRVKELGGTVRWNQRIAEERLVGTCVEISIPI